MAHKFLLDIFSLSVLLYLNWMTIGHRNICYLLTPRLNSTCMYVKKTLIWYVGERHALEHCSPFSDGKSSLPSIEECILHGKGIFLLVFSSGLFELISTTASEFLPYAPATEHSECVGLLELQVPCTGRSLYCLSLPTNKLQNTLDYSDILLTICKIVAKCGCEE